MAQKQPNTKTTELTALADRFILSEILRSKPITEGRAKIWPVDQSKIVFRWNHDTASAETIKGIVPQRNPARNNLSSLDKDIWVEIKADNKELAKFTEIDLNMTKTTILGMLHSKLAEKFGLGEKEFSLVAVYKFKKIGDATLNDGFERFILAIKPQAYKLIIGQALEEISKAETAMKLFEIDDARTYRESMKDPEGIVNNVIKNLLANARLPRDETQRMIASAAAAENYELAAALKQFMNEKPESQKHSFASSVSRGVGGEQARG